MGEKHLIDSNAVLDYLAGKLPVQGMEYMHSVVNFIPCISIITKIEVLGFEFTDGHEKTLASENF